MSGQTDLPTPAAPDTAHVPAELYGRHVFGTPSTELAPIRADLPTGRRRAGVLTLALRAMRGATS